MPAAKTQSDLIAITKLEWSKLDTLLDQVDPAFALAPDGDGISIRDIVTHRSHWIGLFFQWREEGKAGGPVAMPDHGVKWSELKSYNARLRADHADVDWASARVQLADRHADLLRFMTDASDDTLYARPMPGGSGWTTGRYAEASGPSHYRSAAKYIRARLKARA